jgi:hypothetical protein
MRGEMMNKYRKLNSEDQKEFRRWLCANTVVGAILLAGLIALGSKLPGDESGTTAQNAIMHICKPNLNFQLQLRLRRPARDLPTCRPPYVERPLLPHHELLMTPQYAWRAGR